VSATSQASYQGAVQAYDLNTGSLLWTTNIDQTLVVSDLLLGDDGCVYVAASQAPYAGSAGQGGEVIALDQATGATKQTITNIPGASQMILFDSVLFVTGWNTTALPVGASGYDTQAPWPVQYHDNQRTSNATAPLNLGVAAGATPTGPNVSVQPAYSGGASPVAMTFSSVTQAGTTTLTTSGTGTPPPTGFKLGNPPMYYDLSTTAVFSGSATVCINYSGVSFGNPSNLRLFHYQNGAWTDVTTSVNTATTTICGAVTSFSPFAIFESAYTATVQQPINADGSSVFSANRGAVPVKFTLALNGISTCQLPPATISLTRTSGGTVGSVNESSFSLASDSGSNFRIDSINCQYVYNLGTSSLGTGTYQVQIIIGGAAVGSAKFGLQ
jgi:hypothetical protein